MRTVVVVMSKVPEPGFTKTRLMLTLSEQECAEFHRACLADTCQAIRKSGLPGYIYYAEQKKSLKSVTQSLAEADIWGLPEEERNYFKMRPQQGEDLGGRMYNAVRELLTCYEAVILLGSDMPDITAAIILEAQTKLFDHDIVLGPAHDGGYYLLGIKQASPHVFQSIPWGTSLVLTKTMKRISEKNLTFYLLKTKSDIDTWDDLVNFYYTVKTHTNGFYRRLAAYKSAAGLVEKYRNIAERSPKGGQEYKTNC